MINEMMVSTLKTIVILLVTLFACCKVLAQSRDYNSMTKEELAAYEYERGARWRFRKPNESPFTFTLGPNITMSYVPVKYARGTNHDFGFDASITYRNIYLDYNHSFTKSYFTFQGVALGYAFTFANDENGMIVSPNIGLGTSRVEIPVIAGYYRHTFYLLGLGTDVRFYMGRAIMGFNYRYRIVCEDHRGSVNTLSFNFGYRIW